MSAICQRAYFAVGCYLFVFTSALAAAESDVNARYPYRIPEWLWQDEGLSGYVDATKRSELERDIRVLGALDALSDSDRKLYDDKEIEIAKKLASYFASRDLTRGMAVHENMQVGTQLCLRIDPQFTPEGRQTIERGALLLVRCATDEAVIQEAFDSSIAEATPMPEKYELKDGQSILDAFGKKVLTSDYQFFLESRHRPSSVVAFRDQLLAALRPVDGDPTLLIVSQYSGNVWWGGGYYGYYNTNSQQLQRREPARGVFYVRLNSDKFLAENEPRYNDPAFWAGRLGHEMLHNLDYYHPGYADPAERDANNEGNTKAFIVAYEQAVMKAAAKLIEGDSKK